MAASLRRHGTQGLSTPMAVAAHGGRINSFFDSLSRCPCPWRDQMTLSMTHLQPIVALIAGVLILIMPRLLNFIVAIYLILVGIIGLGIIK